MDGVKPAETVLPECFGHEAVREVLNSDIESCSDYHGSVVAHVKYQPLLAAVYMAFSQHRPLVLTPDAVWITIAQGVAHHMAIHGERLRSRFVAHQGRLELRFVCNGWVERSPENPWTDAFESWSTQIAEHVGKPTHDLLACDFSTSGPLERAVGQIVMTDVFERYFKYVLYCICGIPTVTLEGATADWERLRDKAAGLEKFDMDWWLGHLLPICDQFVRASRGDVDLKHWHSICKLRDEYGGDVINGWVAKLFPYIRSYIDGPCDLKNPIFETGEGIQTLSAPSGLSRVPFTRAIRLADGNVRTRKMEAIGGLIGVTQDPQNSGLRPKVGWAVREAYDIHRLLAEVVEKHSTHSGKKIDDRDRMADRMAPDMWAFYHRTDGAGLFESRSRGRFGIPRRHFACRILPFDHIAPLDFGTWFKFAEFADGGGLAIHLSPFEEDTPGHKSAAKTFTGDRECLRPVCYVSPGTREIRGQAPVVALSFGQALDQLLSRGPGFAWLAKLEVVYGEARNFTGIRR